MKFLKKTAALLFCVALALSVMAVSALANDDPTATPSSTFTVDLVKADADTHQDRDADGVVDYDQGETLTYDVVLKTTAETAQSVSAIDFKVPAVTNLGTWTVTSTYTTPETVSANGESVYSLTLSQTKTGGETGEEGLSINQTGKTVATISCTVNSNALNDTDVTFNVTNIVVHIVSTKIEVTDTPNAMETITIDPEYTVYVFNPAADGKTTVGDDTIATGVITEKKNPSTSITTVASATGTLKTYTYSIFEGATILDTSVSAIPGYTFKNKYYVYKPTTLTDTGWTSNWTNDAEVALEKNDDTNAMEYTIAACAKTGNDTTHKYGNVIFVAYHEPTEYTLTYNLNDTTNATVAVSGQNPASGNFTAPTNEAKNTATMKYTIESVVAASDKTEFGVATREGYTFKGWSVGTSDVDGGFWKSTKFTKESPEKFRTDGAAEATPFAYGNVTLTANWEITGKFAQVAYKYVTDGTVLRLFAVADRPNTGTYLCGGNAMLLLNDTTANGTAAESSTTGAAYTAMVAACEELFTDANALDSNKTYKIYGYLAASNAEITFVSGESNGNTTSVRYNGDVNINNLVNAGDYGIAIDLLKGLGTYSGANALTVENLLRVHINSAAKTTSNESVAWGSIDDINSIMALAGKTVVNAS